MSIFERSFNKITEKTLDLASRSADRHLRLAVTGLAGAGKTAFITGLVNQLLASGTCSNQSSLPLWQVNREGRLLGVKSSMQPDLDIATFDYPSAMACFSQEPTQWPASTRTITELRLAIKYRPEKGLLAKLSDTATLYLDIVDYPGEWLLDLPMLKLDYCQWSISQSKRQQAFQQSPLFADFENQFKLLDLEAPAQDKQLKLIAGCYRSLLIDLVQNQGYYLAQPGRMLLPGEYEDTPLLTFFPLLNLTEEQVERYERLDSESNYKILKRRYQEYVSQVVKPFYRNHFASFDRQLVLVDCFSALNKGRSQFEDMTHALNGIVESFQFGQSSLLRRLFSPRVDKLLFAASKVDHITRDQQGNTLSLLSDMLSHCQHFASFEGCEVETMAISAIKSTQHGMVKKDEQSFEVVRGLSLEQRKAVTLYPGEVPRKLPDSKFWQKQGFEFVSFAPPFVPLNRREPFEHIRLDHLLQFLLGDKLE
ncbi:YcjX family protein [Shewanella gelidii]|uniref:ATPase n=1 Tax=Shewanella gelidii TaxID=1642821 RepID=A0A917JNG1_9GAMM|nr:YcjX family protein [Shewanella gelidii]MCL1097456.1 YcjX family protein [Shewanella gelidii]GGI75313.1 ATPase [Shewanella gelidii]